jgi:hypothetical protein
MPDWCDRLQGRRQLSTNLRKYNDNKKDSIEISHIHESKNCHIQERNVKD